MWPFKRQNTPQELRVTEIDLELLRDHGLAAGSSSFTTMVSGIKDKRTIEGDIGRILPTLVVSCTQCKEHASWGKGDSVSEEHWSIDQHNPDNTMGLSLTCPYDVLWLDPAMALPLDEGGRFEELVRESRFALVRVELSDLLSVQTEPLTPWRAHARKQGIPVEHLPEVAPVDIRTRRLKVLDVVDQLRLGREMVRLNTIAGRFWRSGKGLRVLHGFIDAMQPKTWREFSKKFAMLAQRSGMP